jgi:hypothetical protein
MGGVDCNYDRRNGWYNIMRLTGDHRANHQNDWMVRVPWPPQVKDFRRVGVKHVLKVIDLRRQRGGLFRAPVAGDEPFVKELVNAAV